MCECVSECVSVRMCVCSIFEEPMHCGVLGCAGRHKHVKSDSHVAKRTANPLSILNPNLW